MASNRIKYEFSAKVYQYSSSAEMSGWIFVSLPKDLPVEIRDNFKWLEEGLRPNESDSKNWLQ